VGLDVISYVHDELGDPYYTPHASLKSWSALAGSAGRPGVASISTQKNSEGVRPVAVSARVKS